MTMSSAADYSAKWDQSATKRWYDEVKDYDYATGQSKGGAVGHFTQVVWKNSKKLGCGHATKDNGHYAYVTCRYSPPGNYIG